MQLNRRTFVLISAAGACTTLGSAAQAGPLDKSTFGFLGDFNRWKSSEGSLREALDLINTFANDVLGLLAGAENWELGEALVAIEAAEDQLDAIGLIVGPEHPLYPAYKFAKESLARAKSALLAVAKQRGLSAADLRKLADGVSSPVIPPIVLKDRPTG